MPRQTSHKNRAQEEGAMVAQFDELQKYLYKRKATDQLDLLPSASKLHFEDMRFGSLGGSDRKWVSKQLFLGEGRDWAMWAILETSNRGGVSFVLEQFHGGERRAQMLDNANGLEIMYPFRAVSENRYSARQLEVLVAYFFLEAGHSTRVFPPTSANVSFKAFAACLMAIEKFYQDNGGIANIPGVYAPDQTRIREQEVERDVEGDVAMTEDGEEEADGAAGPWSTVLERRDDVGIDYEELAEAERKLEEAQRKALHWENRVLKLKERIAKKEATFKKEFPQKFREVTQEELVASLASALERK